MSKIKQTISEFTDREFAFFYHYRKPGLLPVSQQLVDENLQERGLSPETLDQLRNEPFEPLEGHCPRCNSSRLFQETRNHLVQSGDGSYEKDVHTLRCIVCHYNPGVDKPINNSVRVDRWLGRHRRKEIK